TGDEPQAGRYRQTGARGGRLEQASETFEARRERSEGVGAADGVEIEVDDHQPPRRLVHLFEPDARSDEAPFLRAEQAYAQAARTFGYLRREQACKSKRDRYAAGVIHCAFAMRMAVDIRADHDPIRAADRQVRNHHAPA